ncbi:flagellar hook-associated protein 3 [Pseudomonas sp. F3-2]|uniref:flagellar hook-associated protein 3 n=1 Tax=Pseudomonas sp. F3-2 TaxID=3141539 RepID=UPI00315D7B93
MRISTTQFYETSASNYSRTYANVVKTGDEVASQVKLNTAADDPVGAARVLQLQQMGSMLNQYKSNIDTINTNVVQTETAMTSITSAIQRAQELVLSASNATYTDKDRQANAAELKEVQSQILGLMNSKDASGAYLFSGSKSTTAPYAINPDGTYSYQGDQTRNMLSIGSGISMASNTTGWDAFEQAVNTTRTSATLTAGADDGVISLSGGSVSNAATYDSKFTSGQPYQITFLSSTQYQILDKDNKDVTAEATSAGKFDSSSASNQAIGFRGLELNLNINLTDAQRATTGNADDAVKDHTFTLAVTPSTVSTARLPTNSPGSSAITSSTVTDQDAFNTTFPNGGAVLRFTSSSDYELYAAPYVEGSSQKVASGSLSGSPVANQAVAAGVTFTLSGNPPTVADGDTFSAQSSTQQTQNILNTLSAAITALNSPVDGDPVATQKLQATLTSTIGNLKSASDQILEATSDGGARARTSTDQGVTNQNLIDNGTTEAGTITASDPVDAIARLTLQKTMLQASQLVFTQLSALNLFSKL